MKWQEKDQSAGPPPTARRRRPPSGGAAPDAPAKQEKPEADSRVRTALALMLIRLMPVWLILAGIMVAAVLFLPLFGKPLVSFTQQEEISVSDLVLAEVREICRLNTVECHYKVVFPFDFDRPGVTETKILAKIKKHLNADLGDFLSPDERLWLKAVSLARANGLNPYAPKYDFLVATVVIKGGFDLQGQPPRLESSSRREGGRTIRSATLVLPPATVTSVVVEDPLRENYPFPDLALSPRGWKEIAGFIKENAVDQGVKDGLLDKAARQAAAWLEPLLIQAGYDEISIQAADL
jgi:hypothetical protein